ncbi:hypothetical protein RB620_04380 [Paenibacillus sp. LHD-117]|uniref:hypothetical protein n=1 Tax=Paenibacillus sp. LHD-117 TaxID=3071412 RepID=UPI0027E20AB8|nr:hypothetical protein [Paenibacillus sp. LHD-117]MDQ6418669.1 hypothetical protein [Paenibacillus sp. LHD-117]
MNPIQYPIVQPGGIDGMLPPRVIREWRGVNGFDPYSIADSFFTDASNVTTDDFPAFATCEGYEVLGSAIGAKVLGLGVWKDAELHAIFDDGTWRKWTGAAWSTALASGLNTTAMWSFTNFEGGWGAMNLVGCNGVNGLRRYDGSTVQAFGNAPSNANHVTTYQNRLWVAFGLEIRACQLDNGNIWDDFSGDESDSYGKTLESAHGENVNMLSGGLAKLVIGMPNALQELYGSIPSDFQTRPVSEETGVENNNSALIHDATLYGVHRDSIYTYVSGGVSPDREFSDIVRKFIAGTSGASTGSDGRKLYFFVPGKILIYDTVFQTWTIRTGITVTCFTLFKNELYIGTNDGRVVKLGGETDAGQPINWHVVTRIFTNGSISQRSRWLKLHIMAELAVGSTINVYLSETQDGNDWELVKTITGTGAAIEKVLVPVKKFVLSNMLRVKLEGIGWARVHELSLQGRQLPLT